MRTEVVQYNFEGFYEKLLKDTNGKKYTSKRPYKGGVQMLLEW
jgi:hypothetical protein